jgi:hypothetical protein
LRQRTASWFDLVEAGLPGREGCDRVHYRRRPGRRVRARDHGRAQLLADGIAHSLAASAARRLSSGHWASTSRSVAKAERAGGSSGCVQLSKIPSAPSAGSAASGTMGWVSTSGARAAGDAAQRGLMGLMGTCSPWARPQTVLTVLTQMPAFGWKKTSRRLLGSAAPDGGRSAGPSSILSGREPRTDQDLARGRQHLMPRHVGTTPPSSWRRRAWPLYTEIPKR